MTPDKKPFFAGTYIPRESRFGRIGMLELIPRINKLWNSKRDEILSSAEQLSHALQRIVPESPGKELGEHTLNHAFEQLSQLYDQSRGGFRSAPKFPIPHNHLFLLRYWKRTGNKEALNMVENILSSMRRGGIFDHLGFGFHRYSTDSEWLVPHFEKMLYDQALLAMVYTETFQATKRKEFEQTTHEILDYVLRDMTAKDGAFYSAEDADSEGEEGRFYLWTQAEIEDILESEDADLIIKVFSIAESGNYREEATREKTGKNILHLNRSLTHLESELSIPEADIRRRIESARKKLLAVRDKRVNPFKDDKILTDWNGLMIAACAKAARVFNNEEYTRAAERAVDFILNKMRDSNNRLLHRHRAGESDITAYLDDYAFIIWGLLELYETTFKVHYIRTALELNDVLIKHFWDGNQGGFYFTADYGEELLIRQKTIYDGAVPSGNSVAMLNLLRLSRITGNADFEKKAMKIAEVFSKSVGDSPSAHTQLLNALDFAIGPSYEVVMVGDPKDKGLGAMLEALRTRFMPNIVVILRPTDQESPEIINIAEFIKNHTTLDDKTTAYVCLNHSCRMPTTDLNKMLESLVVN